MSKKKELVETTETTEVKKITSNDIEWTDHVLSFLNDDEKISGNPTTDGLRRIFETVLNCTLIRAETSVVQSPSLDNERRATVVHTLQYYLNSDDVVAPLNRTVSGAADVYWGNCDKVYRNHPVAVAETRAEGRALRRALKLRKVVAAEEIAKDIEDHTYDNEVNKISDAQINFIDVLAKRLNINTEKFLSSMGFSNTIKSIDHSDAITLIQKLSSYQQDTTNLPDDLKGYVQSME
jgi:hypothetical protein